MYVTVNAEVEIDVDEALQDIDTDDLVKELERRNGLSLHENIDQHELAALVQKVQVAIYSNNQHSLKTSVEKYFDRVHGITTH